MERELIVKQFSDLRKAVFLLRSSVDKYDPYDLEHIYSADELEFYDSLSLRFEKCVELTLNFFRTLELFVQSKQSDTLRDRLLQTQKLGIIKEIDFWMEVRLLGNKIIHAYLPEDIKEIYQSIFEAASEIFATIDRLNGYFSKKKLAFAGT